MDYKLCLSGYLHIVLKLLGSREKLIYRELRKPTRIIRIIRFIYGKETEHKHNVMRLFLQNIYSLTEY